MPGTVLCAGDTTVNKTEEKNNPKNNCIPVKLTF